jgi:hypothetical protein
VVTVTAGYHRTPSQTRPAPGLTLRGTMMRLGSKLLLVLVLLCLPLGCEPPYRDSSTSSSQHPIVQNSNLNFAEILPEDWQHVITYRMDANGDGDDEWIVLYRFDLLNEGGKSSSPIAAIVYRTDDSRPPNVISHELRAQDGDYLCECTCTLSIENVLSGLEDDELVVRDFCSEKITRVTIFHWDKKEEKYVPRGHFCGHHVTVNWNQVTVEQPWPGRAQLIVQEIYHPCDDNTTYRRDFQGTPEICAKKELVFSQGEPEDVMRSPYPEKVVLAFYNHFADEKASTYFTEEGWARVGQCSANQCGCISARGEIAHVRVIELTPEYESYSPNKDLGPDQATVVVTVACEHRNGASEAERSMRWHLIREDDRWQLERPE